MAKRFTDSEKWKKPWFRGLSPLHKCFWEYLRDNCDHAGVWEVDFDLAEFHIGGTLKRDEITRVFAKQFYPFAGGKRWFLVDFIDYQYGQLKNTNNAHTSAIKILQKYGLWEIYQNRAVFEINSAPAQPLPSPCPGAVDMDKDQDKDLDKGDPRGKPKFSHDWISVPEFAAAWDGWVEMRVAKKKRPTEYAKKLAMKALQGLCGGEIGKAIEIVNESTLRSWEGFFPLKEVSNGVNGKHPQGYESIQEKNARRVAEYLGPRKTEDNQGPVNGVLSVLPAGATGHG